MAIREAMQAAIDDPNTASIKRRVLRRKLAGIIAVGPTVLRPSPPPAPTRADEVRARRAEMRVEREHAETVRAEIAALDAHVKKIEKRLAGLAAAPGLAVGPGAGGGSFEAQELRAEMQQLRELRRNLEGEINRPITRHTDGRPVDGRMRAIVRARAKELAESYWAASQRDAAAGDHREARRHRIDALRSRLVAEYELNLRPFLPGYSQPWS